MVDLSYDEVIEVQGVRIPIIPGIVTGRIEQSLRKGRYEAGEARALRAAIRPGDRVLELGGGIGLLSTVAATVNGVGAVMTVEADPALIPLIAETHRLNGVAGVAIRAAAVTRGGDARVGFFRHENFWASSTAGEPRGTHEVLDVPAVDFDTLLAEFRPSVLACDIEGAERALLAGADLAGIREIVLELHPRVYGAAGVEAIHDGLEAAGFLALPRNRETSVRHFVRAAPDRRIAPLHPETSTMPVRGYRSWPIAEPRVMIATCMKDEGPYILEWLAWHRAIGVTDVVVFTNHCSDGTLELLDRLHEMGEVMHLPNPAAVAGGTGFQAAALAFAQGLPAFRAADFFVSMDVDEFINIRVGAGQLCDLFAATGRFDVLSLTELNHGSNGRARFAPGFVRDQFPGHQTLAPRRRKAHRGVKSITRLGPRVQAIRNHRPDVATGADPVLWLDGSGARVAHFTEDARRNGHDCRGTYDLAVLDHFALRALDSYLMKHHRGDVVRPRHRVSRRYWRLRNHHAEREISFDRADPLFRAQYARYAADGRLMALHEDACRRHAAMIEALKEIPFYREERAFLLENHW